VECLQAAVQELLQRDRYLQQENNLTVQCTNNSHRARFAALLAATGRILFTPTWNQPSFIVLSTTSVVKQQGGVTQVPDRTLLVIIFRSNFTEDDYGDDICG